MNIDQEWLCKILEESTDIQEGVPWHERDWDQAKLNAYIASCLALKYYIQNDKDVLARMLRCFCDSESGGVQFELATACEAYTENPYEDERFVNEVLKAAPEMLKKSPKWFGDTVFTRLFYPYTTKWTYFLQTFKNLDRSEQQIIIDYLTYLQEELGDPDNCDNYQKDLDDCVKESGIAKGDSQYFHEHI